VNNTVQTITNMVAMKIHIKRIASPTLRDLGNMRPMTLTVPMLRTHHVRCHRSGFVIPIASLLSLDKAHENVHETLSTVCPGAMRCGKKTLTTIPNTMERVKAISIVEKATEAETTEAGISMANTLNVEFTTKAARKNLVRATDGSAAATRMKSHSRKGRMERGVPAATLRSIGARSLMKRRGVGGSARTARVNPSLK